MPALPEIAQDRRRLSGLAKARTSKLNLEQAEAIRGYAEANPGLDRREMYRALGAQYGVAPTTIEDVVRHHTWRTEARRREALVASGVPMSPVTPPPAIVSAQRLREINARQVALFRAALTACWLLLMVVPAFAQVPAVVNPQAVSWDSPDHTLASNGQPVVTRYLLELAAASAPSVVVKTVDMGKPALVNGRVEFVGLDAIGRTLPVGSYIAVVRVEGPGGVAPGALSDPFTLKVPAPSAPGKPVWK